MAKITLKDVAKYAVDHDGATYDLNKKVLLADGTPLYMVSLEGYTKQYPIPLHYNKDVVIFGLEAELIEFVDAHINQLKVQGQYLGVWRDEPNFCIDISIGVRTQAQAERLARWYHQKAIYDMGKGKVIDIVV